MHSRFTLFPLFIFGFLMILEIYAWFGLQSQPVQSLGFSSGVEYLFAGLFGVAVMSLLVITLANRRMSKAIRNFFFAFVFINLFTVLVFDLFLLIDDVIRGVRWIFVQSTVERHFIIVYFGLIAAVIPGLLFILGMILGPYRYRVIPIEVRIKNLPDSFDGFRMAQISDVHAGSLYNKKAVKRGVKMINDLQPDLIVFTGDLVNDEAHELAPFQSIFASLQAPHGVYSILGNHDYGEYVTWPNAETKQKNLQQLIDMQGEMRWNLLLNEHVYIRNGEDQIALIGVENWGKGFGEKGDLQKAYEGCHADTKILLSHDPTHWDEVVRPNYPDIDLTLSGHTHGAQMGIEWGKIRWSPIKLRYKKWAGLYQNNGQQLYINRGFGFLGYPGRLGIWPEITEITLRKK